MPPHALHVETQLRCFFSRGYATNLRAAAAAATNDDDHAVLTHRDTSRRRLRLADGIEGGSQLDENFPMPVLSAYISEALCASITVTSFYPLTGMSNAEYLEYHFGNALIILFCELVQGYQLKNYAGIKLIS